VNRQSIKPATSVKIFISYSHEDQELRENLEEHLSPLRYSGKIVVLLDDKRLVESDRENQISPYLDEADLILLLISPDFIASESCWNQEAMAALERYEAGTAQVILIILRPVTWEDTPLGQLQALPTGAKPVTQWKDQDAAFNDAVKGIGRIVESLIRGDAQERENFRGLWNRFKENTPSTLPNTKGKSEKLQLPPIGPGTSIKIFISYAYEDLPLREKLEEHLSPLQHSGKVVVLPDDKRLVGPSWENQISSRLDEADLILLLISSSFFASESCWDQEAKVALERYKAGTTQVIPIILRPVIWEDTPLGQLQALPTGAKPVTQWKDQDAAFNDAVKGIGRIVENLIPGNSRGKGMIVRVWNKFNANSPFVLTNIKKKRKKAQLQPIEPGTSVKILISYSREDHELCDKLEEHLSPLQHSGKVAVWHDRKINPGAMWSEEISKHLNEADLILLLISSSFIASRYCWDQEVKVALERYKAGTAQVIPIILKPTAWQGTPLGQLKVFPTGAKPLTQWEDQDAAFTDIVRGIGQMVDSLVSGDTNIPSVPSHVKEIRKRYQIACFLGNGGSAEVYLARDKQTRELVAIKFLHAYVIDKKVKENFLKESKTMECLQHPGIIRIRDIGFDKTRPYLAMDYAPHGSLRERHPEGTILPLETIKLYIQQIGNAIQYAHSEHIIHCDIKPDNILLAQDDRLLLSDFGIARVVHTTLPHTTRGPAGTPEYMAPEQFLGKPVRASDQYALGIMIYEWLCGTPPFKGDFLSLMDQHQRSEVPLLRNRKSTISEEVEQVIRQALAKTPDERYPSIQAFVQAFEQALPPLTP
jgi:tRNA A-37 threonylcarbamoyl transferase component Bud32